MNYLAHLFLARKDEGLIVGALWEDYISGGIDSEKNKYIPDDVKNGLRLHRHIDSFTDSDLNLKTLKELFYPKLGKFAPIVLDVILDHYLHRNWNLFSDESFDEFKKKVYHTLKYTYSELQPIPMQQLVNSMLEYDWLKNYIHWWGIEKALVNLNKKIIQVDLTVSLEIAQQNDQMINEVFLSFFQRLSISCEDFLNTNGK